jgi:hypothetical protein
MKIIPIFILLCVLFGSCASTPSQNDTEEINKIESEKIQENPDYIIDEQGNMLFKDWETAYKYAAKDKDTCITLLESCIRYAKYIYALYSYGQISEDEFNIKFDEIKIAYDNLYTIYMIYFYHEESEEVQYM